LKHKELGNQHEVTSLDEQASSYLKKNGVTSVPQFYDALRVKNPSLNEGEVTDLVWRLVEGGKADVEDTPPAAESLRHYLRIWERNLWFYMSVSISLVNVLVIYTLPTELPLVAARWVLGSVFVLFLPGYVTVEALFPKGRDLKGIERFALSIGSTLTLVMLVGLLLNYTPWGIRLTPIVISLTILTLGLAGVGVGRQYGMSSQSQTPAQLGHRNRRNAN
jgi:hypothetical protein